MGEKCKGEKCSAMCWSDGIYRVKIESWVGNLLQAESVTDVLSVFHFYES